MLKIGSSWYKLIGVDTNVISQILREPDDARRGFISLFAKGYIPCFAVYSLFELRRRREVYDQFVEFFDVYPCMLLKNEDQLLGDELAAYYSRSLADPTVLAFSVLNSKRGTNLKNLMSIATRGEGFLKRERDWPSLQVKLLGDWLSLKENYPPRGKQYDPDEADAFVKRATLQVIEARAPEWVAALRRSGERLSCLPFPSVRMILWTIFHRLYIAGDRTPEPQDVFDVLISAPAPYLDAVVTEKHQADIYRKVKKCDAAISHLRVYSLRDLRAAAVVSSPRG